MSGRLRKFVAGLAVAVGLLGGAAMAQADYYKYVPKHVYVTKYDCYGNPYSVCYTVYVKVLVKTCH